jgi:hypothetical protein
MLTPVWSRTAATACLVYIKYSTTGINTTSKHVDSESVFFGEDDGSAIVKGSHFFEWAWISDGRQDNGDLVVFPRLEITNALFTEKVGSCRLGHA